MRQASWAAALLAVAAVSPAARADVAPWLDPEWTVRRVVEATVGSSGFPGDEVAVCTFYTGGMAKPDGSDVRVAVRGRQFVPHRVLQAGPGDLLRVAFAAGTDHERYYVYYGNAKAGPPDPWVPKRGVILEARRWPGGPFDRFDQVQKGWEGARPLGCDFVKLVAFGFNPFADSVTPAVFHFTGWFAAPDAGTYEMATSSDDGSWLLVDGKEVVAWPGVHGALRDARHAGTCVLSTRVHRLDYWCVTAGGSMMALAAWRRSGGARFEPIPTTAFLPVTEARLVELDLRGERLVADFMPKHVGEAWWPHRYAVRIRFQNLSKGVSERFQGRFEWDFGDGQTSTAANPAHIYLASGDYTVALKASRGLLSNTFRTRIRVERDWWRQTSQSLESTRAYADQVSGYDFGALDPASLALAVDLLDREEMGEVVIRAASVLVARQEGVGDHDLRRVGLLLAKRLRQARRADEAIGTLRRLEARLRPAPFKAEAAVEIAETLLRDLRRHDEAEKEYERVLAAYSPGGAPQPVRRAHVGLGDIHRHHGDFEKARDAYRQAAAIRVRFYPGGREAVRIGTLTRYVEEYTRTRQWEWAFQFLDDWAWEFPEEKLEGHWSLLRARALVAHGQRDAAVREARDLLAANARSPYAVRLLILVAECEALAGRDDQARRLLQTAVEDYPEDAYTPEALHRLRTLGGPPATSSPPPEAGP